MKKRKILVTGSLGTIGSYIPSIFTADELVLTTRKDLDITNRRQVLEKIAKEKPDIVIHLAAKTNVDDCQKNKREAKLTNTTGTKNLADACKNIGATLVYVSTGAVFNGNKQFFTENSRPAPINYLASRQSKKVDVNLSLLEPDGLLAEANMRRNLFPIF